MSNLRFVDINGYTSKRIYYFIDTIICFLKNKFKSKYKKYKWESVYISFNEVNSSYRTRIYEVYLTKDHPRFEYVIKPKKQIKSDEFERLFDFGRYSENRMIGLNKN